MFNKNEKEIKDMNKWELNKLDEILSTSENLDILEYLEQIITTDWYMTIPSSLKGPFKA